MKKLPESFRVYWDVEDECLVVEGRIKTSRFSAKQVLAGSLAPLILLRPEVPPDEARKKYGIMKNVTPPYEEIESDGHVVLYPADLAEYIPQEERAPWEKHVSEIHKLLDTCGCIGFDIGWDDYLTKEGKIKDITVRGRDVEIGFCKTKNCYVAQYGYSLGIDDYHIEAYFFDHIPAANEILTAMLVSNLNTHVMLNCTTIFHCTICGQTKNWWEIEAETLLQKVEAYTHKECGCRKK